MGDEVKEFNLANTTSNLDLLKKQVEGNRELEINYFLLSSGEGYHNFVN